MRAFQRRKRNQISTVINKNNILHFDKAEIVGAFCNFFAQLYASTSPTTYDIEQCTKHMELSIRVIGFGYQPSFHKGKGGTSFVTNVTPQISRSGRFRDMLLSKILKGIGR